MKRFVACSAALVLAACGGGDASSNEATQEGAAAAQASGPQGNATITGTVSFAGTPPANPPIDMSAEGACKSKHSGTITDPQVVVNDGKVANVIVYVKSG